jgi:pimeloyl-ACP methyl ester carboxylesterase
MREEPFSAAVDAGAVVGVTAGEGRDALVLHGGPGLSDYTGDLAAVLSGHGLRTIRYQQRGLSPSTLAPPFDVETHVADAVAVLDALGIERALAIGHSWGGHLAFHLAVAHPERVEGVIAIGSLGATGTDGGWSRMGETMLARLQEIDPQGAARAGVLEALDEPTDAEAAESLALVWPAYFADMAAAPPMPEMRLDAAAHVAAAKSILAHFERGTLTKGLPAFAGPFVLIHGDSDALPIETLRETAALVPHSVVEELAACGHFPWLEQPAAFGAALDRALSA